MTSASDNDTEGQPIAVQKECQNTEIVSGDCSATSMAIGGKERIKRRGEKQIVSGAAWLATSVVERGRKCSPARKAQAGWAGRPGCPSRAAVVLQKPQPWQAKPGISRRWKGVKEGGKVIGGWVLGCWESFQHYIPGKPFKLYASQALTNPLCWITSFGEKHLLCWIIRWGSDRGSQLWLVGRNQDLAELL